MKISQLIATIVKDAEAKFGVSPHTNDNIHVWMWFSPDDTWQVGLERPSQNQLDAGMVRKPDMESVKVNEMRYAFWTEGDTLLHALRSLQDKIENADEFDFIS